MNIFWWCIICCAVFIAPALNPVCEAATPITWQKLDTKHTRVEYQSEDQLIQFNAKIEYLNEWPGKDSADTDIKETLINKIDALFEKVQSILDMRGKTERVKIKIYADKASLNDAHLALFSRKSRFRSWYLFERNTIYLTVEDIQAGMLAHEIAHAIIDHYFSVRPPEATAEILARYVDNHLLKP